MIAIAEEIEVYCTKFALTKRGVFKLRGTVHKGSLTDIRPAFIPTSSSEAGFELLRFGDWHVTEAGAVQRVIAMARRARKDITRRANALNEVESLVRRGKLPMREEAP